MGDSIVSVAGSHETELIILFHDPLHPCFVTVFEYGGVGSRSTILPLNLTNCSGNSNKKQNYQYFFRTITRKDRRESRKTGALLAALLAALVAAPTQAYAQDDPQNLQFRGWSAETQDGYIQSAVTMTAVIAGYMDQEFGACIGEWYAMDARSSRNDYVRHKIVEFPDHHPNPIILAVVQEACGDFRDTL